MVVTDKFARTVGRGLNSEFVFRVALDGEEAAAPILCH